jgi:uncharacterized protein YraI
MKLHLRWLFALAVTACAPMAAAQTATVTSSANVRAGPDKAFPTVTWLLTGTSVTVVGCMANWHWCDVVAGRDRGWVYSRYLSYAFEGGAVTIRNGGPRLGLPAIEFSVGPYWDAHYSSKRWFGKKASLQSRWDREPPPRAWREPRSAPGNPTAR